MLKTFTEAAIRLLRFLVAAVFGATGTVIGALRGLFSGLIDVAGMMQETLAGSTTGALLSILKICRCEDYCVQARNRRTVRYASLLSLVPGNLWSNSVFAVISGALDSQIDALQPHFDREEHRGDLFQPSYQLMAARTVTVHGYPMTELTKETTGQHTSCIICLNEFQAGEIASSLPSCCHVFHLACIDSWFRRKPECPICRHPVY